MKQILKSLFILVFVLALMPLEAQVQVTQSQLEQLPALSDGSAHHGWAASFCGVHNDRLILAGGSAFPDAKPWENGIKKYSDQILVLTKKDGANQWLSADNWKLPRPLSGGAAVSLPEGVFCTGGANNKGLSDQSFLIRFRDEQPEVVTMPALPFSLKDHGMGLIDRLVYVVGGVSAEGYNLQVLQFNLDQSDKGWQQVAGLPHALTHAVVESQTDGTEQCLYVIGGRYKKSGDQITTFSSEVWMYKPSEKRWTQKKDLALKDGREVTLAAAAGVKIGASHILVVGGDDGSTFNRVEKAI
ncbi:MAG: hypothetical protein JEZ14_23935, partial [Marinilabiliaceae bacterium]|nr:hypothetical protein [Marinilabiliaceae bacterium]